MRKKKQTVSLVLGSGGARGYAHIGVIEVLQEQGYEIRSISGSSMGALIGGLYACGRLDAYKAWVLTLDIIDLLRLLDFSFAATGVIKGDKVFDILEKLIAKPVMIEKLPIDFTAVATDINSQKEVWFQEGDLLEAIRASIAIPTVFTPESAGSRLLVDGGILNPLPTVPLLSNTNDLLIAVNLNGTPRADTGMRKPRTAAEKTLQTKIADFLDKNFFTKESRDEVNYFTIFSKTIETMQNLITRYELAAHQPDILMEIPKNLCGFYEFHRAEEIIAYGRQIATEALMEHARLENYQE